MANAAKLELVPKDEVDETFLRIFEQLGQDAIGGAAACTGAIFQVSSAYMEKPAFEAMKKFYDLYYSRGEVEKKKDEVNTALDSIIDSLQDKLAAGEELTLETEIDEDEQLKRQRLSLSAVQKQLEGLIVLDAGLKDQVLPAMSSMQFEDAIRQRLLHVIAAWWKIVEILHKHLEPKEVSLVARDIAKLMTSVDETRSYYEIVLNEEPPEGQDERSVFIEF